MELVTLTHENLDKEHICCAISNNRDIQVMSKKNWLKDRLDEGLVFLKGNVRGKCFIEYIPAEYAWAPIGAEGYMYIEEDAQNAPSPFTTFSLFHDGQLVTHEILSEKKFDRILAEKGV